jgi:hypothetical protein
MLELRTVLETAMHRFAIAPAPGRPEHMRLSGVTLIPSRGGRVVLHGSVRRRSA